MTPLFVFGTLRHLPLLRVVAGARAVQVEAATLPDHAVLHAVDRAGAVQEFPVCQPRTGAQATGLLLRPDPVVRARLDAYERVFGYELASVSVTTASGPVEALIYRPEPGEWNGGAPWSLDDWARDWGRVTTATAAEVMTLLPQTEPRHIRTRYRMLQARVTSRQRAEAEPAPATLRRAPAGDDVQIARLRAPYTGFFGVEEADLRFRRFDGALSRPVTRAAFVMADAVTVLPYDPVQDLVLLVEQYRFGVHTRGDRNPWVLETIAGRIDAGETPEDAARRESLEEAGLELRALLPVPAFYPSPAAVSEFIHAYVGLATLDPGTQATAGLETEAEDIRPHVLPFPRLLHLIDSGEVATAPVLISALWLASQRDALRAESR
ncbi:NUDIX domain-containing protein [Pararhodobacter sp. SW119]|uniref:NUDIX domain-containing protein n=1 Tax=Pararhodobacter sp. SW119 TaxID=2780075 RepID=UPI001ADFC6D3|nr:NUDIX domain-containing protein [Pararhodobacter sp. SW119]